MGLGTPIDSSWLFSFGEPIHRSCRRKPKPRNLLPQENGGVYLHDDALRSMQIEAIRSSHARPIQHGVDGHDVRVGRWCFKVKLGKIGELFRLVRKGHIDGDTARRQTVLVKLIDGPKLRSSQKSTTIVLAPIYFCLISE